MRTKLLGLILLIALFLRLGFSLSQDPMQAYQDDGGDQLWYLANGYGYFAPTISGTAHGIRYTRDALGNPPVYLIVTGAAQHLFSPAWAIRVLWILQSLAGTVTIYFAYRITRCFRLPYADNAALVVATALAFSPAFVLEPRYLLTESLYIFFIMAALWLYADFLLKPDSHWGYALLVGALLGLATLTRAVALLYPVGLVGLIGLVYGKTQWKRGVGLSLALLIAYTALVSTWTLHNWLNFNRFIIVSNQMMPMIWRGAVSPTGDPAQNDELLAESSATEQVQEVLQTAPVAYAQRRISELITAFLQPHGTIPFGEESLKASLEDWLNSGLSWEGFIRLVNGEGFWIKLLIYLWYYVALLGGLSGMWLSRKDWRVSLALLGFILYTLLLHLIFLALPRYLFPAYPLWWIFAALAWTAPFQQRILRQNPHL